MGPSALLLLLSAPPVVAALVPPCGLGLTHRPRLHPRADPLLVEEGGSPPASEAASNIVDSTLSSPPLSTLRWLTNTVTSDAIAPAAAFFLLHAALRASLLRAGVRFPASVIGMLGGFFALLATRAASERSADRVEAFFQPACRLYRTWLACIFAPGFVALPLRMPPLQAGQLLGFFLAIGAGFVTSTASNAAIASRLAPPGCARAPEADGCATSSAAAEDIPPALASTGRVASPFPRAQRTFLLLGAAASLGAYLLSGGAHPALLNAGLLCATLASFALASALCPPAVQLWFHPFLATSLSVLATCALVGTASGGGYLPTVALYSDGGAGQCEWHAEIPNRAPRLPPASTPVEAAAS